MLTNKKPILVPIDFSSFSLHALKEAVFHARITQSEIIMLHVVQNLLGNSEIQAIVPGQSEFKIALIGQIEKQFEDLIAEYGGSVNMSYRIENGSAHKTTVKIAEIEQASMIFMGTKGASGVESVFIGTNADRVVASANCPVLTIREPRNSVGYKRIVLPIDTSKYTRQKLSIAMQMAMVADGEIHILGVSTESSDKVIHELNILTENVAKNLKENDINHIIKIETGNNLTDITLKYAASIMADLIVIMTEQEPTIENLFLGESAQQMVHKSPIPVLSIRPKPVEGIHTAGY